MEIFLKVFSKDIVRSLTIETLWAFLSDKMFRNQREKDSLMILLCIGEVQIVLVPLYIIKLKCRQCS